MTVYGGKHSYSCPHDCPCNLDIKNNVRWLLDAWKGGGCIVCSISRKGEGGASFAHWACWDKLSPEEQAEITSLCMPFL
jgi:hypothetical protein